MESVRGKKGDILQHCIYEIATGKWEPGMKLPSVREAEKMWGINRHTVLAAYKELEKIGLVHSKLKSGYYINESNDIDNQSDKLFELYNEVKGLIKQNTDFGLTYVLRYFGALASSESKEFPNYAFLECTDQQAANHASEIFDRLNVHVYPVCLNDDGKTPDIPESVEVLLTTGFHIKEVKKIGKEVDKPVVVIPIEVDPGLFETLSFNVDSAVLVELEDNMSSNISEDVQQLSNDIEVDESLVRNISEELPKIIADPKNELVLLSPRVWGRTPGNIRRNKKVKLVRFRISSSSWKTVAQTVKVPLGH